MSDDKQPEVAADLGGIQAKVGYGHGTTIGYTENGTVFILTDTQDPDGRPMQTLMELKPDRARYTIKCLQDALEAIEQNKHLVQ